MYSQLLADGNQDAREYLLVFEYGEDPIEGVKSFARENGVSAAHLTAIGAFEDATLAYFDWESREYVEIPVHEQVEVASLVGDVSLKDGKPAVHAHCVLGRRDGGALAGHLLRARVRPTLELALTVGTHPLVRRHDARSGLALIGPEAAGASRE